MSQIQRRKVDWSLLPQELLEKIANFTGSRFERHRFRAVCKKWRSSHSYPITTYFLYPALPKTIPILPSSIFIRSNRPINFVGSALYLIQPPQDSDPSISSKSWIVSVEELNRRRFRVRFPLSKNPIKDLPSDFPKKLCTFDFKVSHIGEGLNLCFSNGNEDVYQFEGFAPCSNYPTKSKVVLFRDEDSPTEDTWSVMVLLLSQGGSLGTLKLDGQWSFIDRGPGFRFDDVISLRRNGLLCGIDREGTAYLIDGSECRVIETMSVPLCTIHDHCYARVSRKFLVLIYSLVFMIVRNEEKFEVYLLREEEHDWIKMGDMGDWILFMTFDNVFAVKAKEIPGSRGNCIVFPKNLFALHSREYCKDYKLFEGVSKYMEVGVYYLDEDRCRPLTTKPGLSELFWPPPSWLLPEDSEEDEDMDSNSDIGSMSCSEAAEPSAALQCIEEGTGAIQARSQSACQGNEAQQRSTPKSSFQCIEEGAGAIQACSQSACQGNEAQQEIPDENSNGSDPVNSFPTETPENVASEDIFEGLEVSPDLIPVLQKIWAKYGNIIEDHAVCSIGLLTWALESLAKMIVILQDNTRASLNESQADYLRSTLVDLQSMNFKLDWLVPYVERAIALHNNNEQVEAMLELETTSKLRAELHELEDRLADQKKLINESVMASTPLILEKNCPLFLI
ncbi:F-box protein SKIP23-like [Chenopodium quinoa]|uniref:F-box protein SKIP23-like n=1 Tax=Chenopodium quinoa TaxID=63459 RepID=UPI000B793EA1|nr:F-box protein SKIP23-like [Chenopodium quinoa]